MRLRRSYRPRRFAATVVIAVGLLVTLPGCSAASVMRFVAPGGSDQASGSATTPWRTIAHAVAASPNGATIVVAPGRYSGFVVSRRRGLKIKGVADEPAPTIAPADGPDPADAVEVLDSRSIEISHLAVTGARGHYEAGIDVERSASVLLSDLELERNVGFGADVVNSVGVTIIDSEIALNATGVQLTRTRDAIVDHNTIFRNDRMIDDSLVPNSNRGANAVVAYQTPGPVTIDDNAIWGNIARSRNYGYDGGAFEVSDASHVTMSGNDLWDNNNVSETGTPPGGQCLDNRFVDNDVVGASPINQSLGLILRCAQNMVVSDNRLCGLNDFSIDITAGPVMFGGAIAGLRVLDNTILSQGSKVYSIDSTLPASVIVDDRDVVTVPGAPLAYVDDHGETDSLATFRAWSGLVGTQTQSVAPRVSCPLPESLQPSARRRSFQKISPMMRASATTSAKATSIRRSGRSSRA